MEKRILKMIIHLNKKFYDKDAVREAISDFSEVCTGRIINDEIEIELIPKTETDKPLKEEFCNYVLGLMKNKALV